MPRLVVLVFFSQAVPSDAGSTTNGVVLAAPGNTDCWLAPWNFETCCGEKFGEGGNGACWYPPEFTYANCCFRIDDGAGSVQTAHTESRPSDALESSSYVSETNGTRMLTEDDFGGQHWAQQPHEIEQIDTTQSREILFDEGSTNETAGFYKVPGQVNLGDHELGDVDDTAAAASAKEAYHVEVREGELPIGQCFDDQMYTYYTCCITDDDPNPCFDGYEFTYKKCCASEVRHRQKLRLSDDDFVLTFDDQPIGDEKFWTSPINGISFSHKGSVMTRNGIEQAKMRMAGIDSILSAEAAAVSGKSLCHHYLDIGVNSKGTTIPLFYRTSG